MAYIGGFRPKKGEIVPQYAYEVFDALCEKCYLSIITIKEIDKCPFYSNKCPECNSTLHQVHYADNGDAENIWWCTSCDVAIDSSGGYTK